MTDPLKYWDEYINEIKRFSMPVLIALLLENHPTKTWHSIEEISLQIQKSVESVTSTIQSLIKSGSVIKHKDQWGERILPWTMVASKSRKEKEVDISVFENEGGLCEKHADTEFVISPVNFEPIKKGDKPSTDLSPLNTNLFTEAEATLLQVLSIIENAENLNKAISQLKLEGESLRSCSPQF
jgi:biotin operon repressor